MARVILRISMDNDTGSKLRNKIAPILRDCGLHNDGTGEWVGDSVPLGLAAEQLSDVLHLISDATQVLNVNEDAILDHVWIHIKNVA